MGAAHIFATFLGDGRDHAVIVRHPPCDLGLVGWRRPHTKAGLASRARIATMPGRSSNKLQGESPPLIVWQGAHCRPKLAPIVRLRRQAGGADLDGLAALASRAFLGRGVLHDAPGGLPKPSQMAAALSGLRLQTLAKPSSLR